MADNYLITGYWGEPHVTAENDRGINAAMFGTGRFVLPVGEQFRAEYIGNNTVRLYDGKLMDNGAAAGIPAGEYVDLLIANAGQGMNRNDLIVFQYSQDSTLVETGTFVVIQGAETSGKASDPELSHGDLLSGTAVFDQMALWRISVSAGTISAPVKLFSVYQNNAHNHSASDITSGALPLNRGGTGTNVDLGNAPTNAIIRKLGGNYNQLYYTATADGAFYATEANGAPKFGTLPIAQGGTGATTDSEARGNLKVPRIDLLWTNASPTSNFPPQTLSLGLNNYSMYIVLARSYRDVSNAVCAIGRTGYGARLNTVAALDTGYQEVRRGIDYTSGSLKFLDVYRNGVVNSDGYLVPQFIYGVRGVQS